MLLQKTITKDFKKKRNKGEVPMYYVKDAHPAIVSREDFEKAQELMVERGRSKGNVEGNRREQTPVSERSPYSIEVIIYRAV